MAVAAPIAASALASSWAIPAIGAVAGGLMAKRSGQNPLMGAALGGLGGAALGPMMGGLGAAGASAAGSSAAGAAGTAASAAPWATAAQGLAAQEAGLGTLGSMGWGGATTGLQGALNGSAGGLLSNLSSPMTKAGMQMMMKPQQQAMPQPAPPMQINQRPPVSMMSLANRPSNQLGNIQSRLY
jgi:hypothetical protein